MTTKMTDAVDLAVAALKALFKEQRIFNVALEEIRRDDGTWRVTVGFHREFEHAPTPSGVLIPARREYRVVTLDAESGDVVAVEMTGPKG